MFVDSWSGALSMPSLLMPTDLVDFAMDLFLRVHMSCVSSNTGPDRRVHYGENVGTPQDPILRSLMLCATSRQLDNNNGSKVNVCKKLGNALTS